MNWRLKGAIQKVLGVVPGGDALHHQLQRVGGGLKDFEREVKAKLEDWLLMAGHLRSVGVAIAGTRFLEIGTGWYPTFPLCLYLGGARRVDTVDLTRHLKADLTFRCAVRIERRVSAIADATGQAPDAVFARQQALVRAFQRGASLLDATEGVVHYHAPGDACATGLPDAATDVVFSNSVLEHVPPDVIAACFGEARRILAPGGVMFHSVNCGDHYAYADRRINQLHYLQFSADEWSKWNNRFLYQNRLRAIDFTELARAAGFAIEIDTSRAHPGRLAQLAELRVHPEFARYTREQLAITSVDFIGRRPPA